MTGAVVTGIGVVAPTGIGVDAHWRATLSGQSGIGRITRFDASGYPAQLAGEVRHFDAHTLLPSRILPQTDHVTRMALVASDLALADASVDPAAWPDYDMGVMTASSAGGFEFGHRELQALWSKGGQYVSAYQSFAWFYAVNTGQISIRHGMRGPGGVLVTEQAGGLDAIGQARRQIGRGVTLAVTGGVDSTLCPWGWVAQLPSGRISEIGDPALAYLPFSARASGHVPGEGGAILIMEPVEAAARREARQVYGEIAGYAATFDPRPGSGRGSNLATAIRLAQADAHITPGDVDVVFADAAAVPVLDEAEAAAITAVFGPQGVPVTAPKTMTGRLYAGGSALDAATALLALRHRVIPPTVNVDGAVPGYQIDLVTSPREVPLRTSLVIARGHHGFNSALVLRRVDADGLVRSAAAHGTRHAARGERI